MDVGSLTKEAVAAIALEGVGEGQQQSLRWLWQTVGATCCWALSDIICDACIRPSVPSSSSSSVDARNEETSFRDCAVAENIAPANAHANGTTPELRKRQRHKSRGTQPHPQPGLRNDDEARGRAVPGSPNGRPTRVSCQALLPPMQSLPATSDVIEGQTPSGTDTATRASPDSASAGQKLSPEQNALVSGVVSILTVLLMVLIIGLGGVDSRSGGSLEAAEVRTGISKVGIFAAIGGCFHFTAYLSTLCAFSSASSTVITPLMQLSAVWMLPFSTTAATLGLGFASVIRPLHLFSVFLICAGGFLPAAEGSLSMLASKRFWQQRAVRYVGLGELLICFYNIILHQATYTGENGNSDRGMGDTLRFFLVSRAANGLTSLLLFAVVPALREHAVAMRDVSPRMLCVAFVGECLSMAGVCSVTFSYSSFYEPSVVNAVEGGLQQIFNLLFALISHRAFGCGREVDYVSVKVISFALVASGLALSTQ